jgi:hypothetical protein
MTSFFRIDDPPREIEFIVAIGAPDFDDGHEREPSWPSVDPMLPRTRASAQRVCLPSVTGVGSRVGLEPQEEIP